MLNKKYFLRVFGLVFLGLALANSQASATEKKDNFPLERELWQLYMARVVTFQPAFAGAETAIRTFQLDKGLFSAPDRKMLKDLRASKTFPEITIVGDALQIGPEKGGIKIELVNLAQREYRLNGQTMIMDPKKPLMDQIHATLAAATKNSQANYWIPTPIASAEAQVSEVADVSSRFGGFAGFALGAYYAGAAVVGAATTGAAATVGTVVAAGAAAGVAAGAVGCYGVGRVANYLIGQTYTSDQFWNCVSTPLSWAGMNPRDTLQVTSIQCPGDPGNVLSSGMPRSASIKVTMRSVRGDEVIREFRFQSGTGHGLHSVVQTRNTIDQVTLVPASPTEPRFISAESRIQRQVRNLSRPANNRELDSAAELFRDYRYYAYACNAGPLNQNGQTRNRLADLREHLRIVGERNAASQSSPRDFEGVGERARQQPGR